MTSVRDTTPSALDAAGKPADWLDMPLCAFDTETTGIDVFTDRIVTASIIHITGDQVQSRSWLADPGIDIPESATRVHGVTTEHARAHGRPHHQVADEVADTLRTAWRTGHLLVAYNAAYDLSLLATHVPDFRIEGPILDPFVLDRALRTETTGPRPARDLKGVCEYYRVRLEDAHSATGDALAAARLAWRMPRVYPDLARIPVDELNLRQAHWYREQAYQFLEYLRHANKDPAGVSTEWPVRRPVRRSEQD